MPGNRIGGLKAAATNKERHGKDFYRNIGRQGGRAGNTGGFYGNSKRAKEAGASGVVGKDGTASQLAQAVRRTAAGLRVVDSVLAEEAKWQGFSPLTGRETEVLRAAETAGSVKEIAGMLGLSSGTVRNHLSAAMAKIDAINRHEAVRIARDNGWL